MLLLVTNTIINLNLLKRVNNTRPYQASGYKTAFFMTNRWTGVIHETPTLLLYRVTSCLKTDAH